MEGTPQRDLFRELRDRFLDRHRPLDGPWALDVGSGPARFSTRIGSESGRVVLVDLSREMLGDARVRLSREARASERYRFVQGDALSPPFREAGATDVVVLGNPLGFAGADSDRTLAALGGLVARGGMLVLEAVAGPGEASAYLTRLPPGAVRRLLAAPTQAVLPRIRREGFRPSPRRRSGSRAFRRWPHAMLAARLNALGFELAESLAVAPALGADPVRVGQVRTDSKGWAHLLEIEETIGRDPDRLLNAAAYLIAARKTREIGAGPIDRGPHPHD